ncbi:hypothetical protein HDV05_005414 [Chytridiales sp. JEL 0842]|nr:hypothetical protein HDV05_005414 [Chytridiales sp. JEL 0842]
MSNSAEGSVYMVSTQYPSIIAYTPEKINLEPFDLMLKSKKCQVNIKSPLTRKDFRPHEKTFELYYKMFGIEIHVDRESECLAVLGLRERMQAAVFQLIRHLNIWLYCKEENLSESMMAAMTRSIWPESIKKGWSSFAHNYSVEEIENNVESSFTVQKLEDRNMARKPTPSADRVGSESDRNRSQAVSPTSKSGRGGNQEAFSRVRQQPATVAMEYWFTVDMIEKAMKKAETLYFVKCSMSRKATGNRHVVRIEPIDTTSLVAGAKQHLTGYVIAQRKKWEKGKFQTPPSDSTKQPIGRGNEVEMIMLNSVDVAALQAGNFWEDLLRFLDTFPYRNYNIDPFARKASIVMVSDFSAIKIRSDSKSVSNTVKEVIERQLQAKLQCLPKSVRERFYSSAKVDQQNTIASVTTTDTKLEGAEPSPAKATSDYDDVLEAISQTARPAAPSAQPLPPAPTPAARQPVQPLPKIDESLLSRRYDGSLTLSLKALKQAPKSPTPFETPTALGARAQSKRPGYVMDEIDELFADLHGPSTATFKDSGVDDVDHRSSARCAESAENEDVGECKLGLDTFGDDGDVVVFDLALEDDANNGGVQRAVDSAETEAQPKVDEENVVLFNLDTEPESKEENPEHDLLSVPAKFAKVLEDPTLDEEIKTLEVSYKTVITVAAKTRTVLIQGKTTADVSSCKGYVQKLIKAKWGA